MSAKSAHVGLARKPSAISDQENAFKRKTHRRTEKKVEHNRNFYERTQYGRAAGPDKLSFVVAGRAGGRWDEGRGKLEIRRAERERAAAAELNGRVK